jgi:hypothetical protein
MSKKLVPLVICLALVVMLGTLAFMPYEAPPPPQPDYVPLELTVTPYGQTVSSSPWHAVWDLYISGGQGSYCIYVIWGDSFPPYNSCGYVPGRHYTFTHDFNKPGNGAGTYYQTWRASGVGGPVYDYTYVVKQ